MLGRLQTIYDHIVHKDGLLFHAIQNLLKQYKYNFVANQNQPPDIEIDFSLVNDNNLIYELIEVKMFKSNRPTDTQVGNLRETVSQVKKAIDKLMELNPDYKLIPKSVVTNITDENVLKIAKTELYKDLKEYNISIYTVIDFHLKVKR